MLFTKLYIFYTYKKFYIYIYTTFLNSSSHQTLSKNQKEESEKMVDILGNVSLTLQSIVTWLMTIVLVLLAAVTMIGFLMFIGSRKFNKYMFAGFVLFTVCTIVFTRVFGYRMEIFNASMSEIGTYTLWYLWFLFNGQPTQAPPEDGSSLVLLLNMLPL